MADINPEDHLDPNFYSTPKLTRQMMTYREWQETAKSTNGYIMSCGERWNLWSQHRGGGIYEISARPNYSGIKKPLKEKAQARSRKGHA